MRVSANLRVERLDGKAFVMRRLSPDCLAGLHLYFPDPWPKKRHHKRRLVDAAWAKAAALALAPDCLFRVASDHEEYFALIDEVLSTEPMFEKLSPEEAGDVVDGNELRGEVQEDGPADLQGRLSKAGFRLGELTPRRCRRGGAASSRSFASSGLRNLRK